MIEPPPAAIMVGSAYRMHTNVPVRSTSRQRCQVPRDIWATGSIFDHPALLTSTSRRARRVTTSSITARTCAWSVTSRW